MSHNCEHIFFVGVGSCIFCKGDYNAIRQRGYMVIGKNEENYIKNNPNYYTTPENHWHVINSEGICCAPLLYPENYITGEKYGFTNGFQNPDLARCHYVYNTKGNNLEEERPIKKQKQ